MISIAGLAPDYFIKNGQLWNMPVYHWKNIKKDNFLWWRKRIDKSLEFFDLVKFQHFRGFSSLWEVPAGEVLAINGKWKSSPGYALFKKLRNEHPTFPFIADDAGDNDEGAYKLRDYFHFPGIEVLQYAFDPRIQNQVHIPFNHIKDSLVYTGTHNDNTIRGWFNNELTKEDKLLINEYFNKTLKIATVHLDFIHMCYNSVASVAIIPMQDILYSNAGYLRS